METTWRESEHGEIVVGSHSFLGSRAGGAALLGAPALFFLYILVKAVFEYSREATGAEWLAALPGLLVVLLLFLVFAVPVWFILAGRRELRIDPQGGLLAVVTDLRFFRWTSSYQMDDVVKVGVRSAKLARGPRGSRPGRTHAVEIHLTRKRTVTVECEDDVGAAQRLSRQLAGVLLRAASHVPVAGSGTDRASPGA